MLDKLTEYITLPSITIFEALSKIDKNKKGFLVVIDESRLAIGTLTDGDIRRALIKGCTIDEMIIGVYRTNFKSLTISDNLCDASEIFKNSAIKFLPIIDKDKKLVNLLTKQQLHTLLLQDIHADLLFDFSEIDENRLDYEIFHRPWGFYKTTVMNKYFQSKIISVCPKSQLSLQSHNYREEHWIVAHGAGQAQIGESVIEIKRGNTLFIPKGCKHRLTNTHEHESLIITEVQMGDYFGEDDIIRYEDVYGRA